MLEFRTKIKKIEKIQEQNKKLKWKKCYFKFKGIKDYGTEQKKKKKKTEKRSQKINIFLLKIFLFLVVL